MNVVILFSFTNIVLQQPVVIHLIINKISKELSNER